MSKFYEKIIIDNLSYDNVVIESKILEGNGNSFITRPELDSVHFMVKDDYFILTKDEKLIANPKNVYGLDKNDWMLVETTELTKELINTLVNNYYDKKNQKLFRKKGVCKKC